MNVYRTRLHRRPLLQGTTDADHQAAGTLGFDVDMFLHPGGMLEWAVCLRQNDDPSLLPGWLPALMAAAD
jgi:hypothetical protein